ncbi:MAG: peptidoglycan DD-metalloendopeptidase family protein [Nitrospirae bacterium]|nr:peptidoglycan DD-metalloendopeptidase family protein [Nitrospirota bacterium]
MQDTGYKDTGHLFIMHHASCIMRLALILLFTIHCSLFTNIASAAKDPKEEFKNLQKEIDTHKEKLEKAKKMEHSVLEELDRTNKDLSQTHAELRKYIGKRKVTENEIRKVEADISVNRAKLERQAEWLKRKLRVMQRYGYSGDVVILLSTSEDIAQLMRRWRYIKELAGYDHKMLDSYKETIKNLAEQESRLKTLHAELKKSEEKIQANEKTIAEKKKGKEMLLSSVRKEKSSYEKMLKELKEASNRLMEIIRHSEEAEAYAAKGFHDLKGKLDWPVNGKVVIPYGAQKDPQFNTPVFRNGIHIKADDNTSAKVVHSGKVVFADWFKGYGQLVIISHGEGYHTLYANLAEIFYKVGDIIKRQQAIGKVGESGTLNAPGLYFEVRYKGKPLDPMQWLKKR